MIIRTGIDGFQHPISSEITPQSIYQNRRQWLMTAAAAGALGWTGREAFAQAGVERPGRLAPLASTPSKLPGAQALDKPTAYKDASTYNNFYEFGTDKSDPAARAGSLKTRPWTVQVEGLVKKPGTYDIETLLKRADEDMYVRKQARDADASGAAV